MRLLVSIKLPDHWFTLKILDALKNLPNLQELFQHGNCETGFMRLPKSTICNRNTTGGFPSLTSMNIRVADSDSLVTLFRTGFGDGHQLEKLSLTIRDPPTQYMIHSLSLAKAFPYLQKLGIDTSPEYFPGKVIRFDSLSPLIACKRLVDLTLNLFDVQPNELESLVRAWPELRKLALTGPDEGWSGFQEFRDKSYAMRLECLEVLAANLLKLEFLTITIDAYDTSELQPARHKFQSLKSLIFQASFLEYDHNDAFKPVEAGKYIGSVLPHWVEPVFVLGKAGGYYYDWEDAYEDYMVSELVKAMEEMFGIESKPSRYALSN